MKRMMQLLVVFGACLFVSFAVQAKDVRSLVQEGLQAIEAEKGHPELCTLTDATYVKLNGETTQGYVDLILEETGCSIGNGNLLFFHRPIDYPLVISVFNKENSEAFAVLFDGRDSRMIRFSLKGDSAADPEHYAELKRKLKKDAFSIVTILSSWAKGAPYDFLKCCELHNHYCPGLSSGYMIAELILKDYPLSPGKKYVWFACPPWCKDDAVFTLLDLTPGKRNLYVKGPAKGQHSEGAEGRWAGIMALWDAKEKTGKAIALQFDWGKVYDLAGITAADLSPKGGPSNPAFFTARVRSAWALIPYLDRPEMFVHVAEEVEITPAMLKSMKSAGQNPYEVIGVVE